MPRRGDSRDEEQSEVIREGEDRVPKNPDILRFTEDCELTTTETGTGYQKATFREMQDRREERGCPLSQACQLRRPAIWTYATRNVPRHVSPTRACPTRDGHGKVKRVSPWSQRSDDRSVCIWKSEGDSRAFPLPMQTVDSTPSRDVAMHGNLQRQYLLLLTRKVAFG